MTYTIAILFSRQPGNKWAAGATNENAQAAILANQIADRVRSVLGWNVLIPSNIDQNRDGTLTFADNVAWLKTQPATDEVWSFHFNAMGDAMILFGNDGGSAVMADTYKDALNQNNILPFNDRWTLYPRKVSEVLARPNSVLFEMGQHDNREYAEWLLANIQSGVYADWFVKTIAMAHGIQNIPTIPVVKPIYRDVPDFPLDDGCHNHGRLAYFGPQYPLRNLRSVSGYYSHKSDLALWQGRAKDMGLYDGKIDGLYGDKTRNAAMEMQRRRAISVDGLIGINTWNAAWA